MHSVVLIGKDIIRYLDVDGPNNYPSYGLLKRTYKKSNMLSYLICKNAGSM